jgi:hypothetical protein
MVETRKANQIAQYAYLTRMAQKLSYATPADEFERMLPCHADTAVS